MIETIKIPLVFTKEPDEINKVLGVGSAEKEYAQEAEIEISYIALFSPLRFPEGIGKTLIKIYGENYHTPMEFNDFKELYHKAKDKLNDSERIRYGTY